MTIETLIGHYNELLKADRVAVSLYLRADRLQLQATLPPSPNSQKAHPHQQRIALKLSATPENLDIADRKARILGRAISEGSFDWNDWRSPSAPKSKSCGEWIEAYKQDFFDRRASTPASRSTWEDHFKFLKKLPPHKALTQKLLKETLLEIPPDTRSRQKASQILAKLAALAGISIDLTVYSGGYGLTSLVSRDLPSDEEILNWRNQIQSPEWQFVYGLLAAYGIRPHELLYLDFQDSPALRILGGKSKPRTTYPCPPLWAEEWGLNTAFLPSISGKDNTAIGQRVTHAFARIGIPFRPYDLRHCWAIRSISYFEPVIAAKMMGHTLITHNQRYHHWLDAAHLKAAFDRSKGQPRP